MDAPHPQPFPIEGKGGRELGDQPVPPKARGRFEHERAAPKVYRRAKRLRANMTYAEKVLWERLRKLDAPFRRQAPIGKYVVDFACHSAGLVIEVDGGVHANLLEVAAADFIREEWLKSQGYEVLRLTNNEVLNDLDAIVARLGARTRR